MEICGQCEGYCDPVDCIITDIAIFCSEECRAEYRRSELLADMDLVEIETGDDER